MNKENSKNESTPLVPARPLDITSSFTGLQKEQERDGGSHSPSSDTLKRGRMRFD
jgi:hypothetical protein